MANFFGNNEAWAVDFMAPEPSWQIFFGNNEAGP